MPFTHQRHSNVSALAIRPVNTIVVGCGARIRFRVVIGHSVAQSHFKRGDAAVVGDAMLARNRSSTVGIVAVNGLHIALDVSLIKQTPTNLQITTHSFGYGVRQGVRIMDGAYQLADAHEHIEPVLGAPLFVDVLHDDDHAAEFIRLMAKWNADYARPDLFTVGRGVKHFAAGTD